jgi:hydroxypyruvate reductase
VRENLAVADQPDLERARATVEQLFQAALAASDPERAVQQALVWNGQDLIVEGQRLVAPEGVHIVAVGKAAAAMTAGAVTALGQVINSGVVVTKDGHVDRVLPERIQVFEAGHPIPDQRGVDATQAILTSLKTLAPGVAVLALISGGGSALLEAPREGLTLDDFQQTTVALLRAGAPIDALNAVRAPLSQVKAGGLRQAAPDHSWATLILSDVLGNDPRVIASGPTVPGRNDPALALETITRFGVASQLPNAVMTALQGMAFQPQPPDERDLLVIVGENARAVAAVCESARDEGLRADVVWHAREGEARDLGDEFVRLARLAPEELDLLLGGGEATVTVRGDGVGGRNTEFALAAALSLEQYDEAGWVIASLATDGQDALTGLAGAIADGGTCKRARTAGVDPVVALAESDSKRVFAVAGGAMETGPTGTNVNDIYFALRVQPGVTAGEGR